MCGNGLHLIEPVETKLPQNFRYLSLCDTFSETLQHENIEPTYSQLLKAKNYESISNKCILNTNRSTEADNKNKV